MNTPLADDNSAPAARGWGLVAGPLAAAAVMALLSTQGDRLPWEGRATAGVATLMAVWWMTEAVPLAATSLIPLAVFPLLGVMKMELAAAPYANKYIFLFMAGFMIARSVERWGLHRRLALNTVLLVGSQPARIVAGFMLATGGLSMWISNTAATVLMLPIALSLVTLMKEQLLRDDHGDSRLAANFGVCMMLGIAYAASMGGVGTLVGTPTNLLLAGYAAEQGLTVSFLKWMLYGLPVSIVMLMFTWWLLTGLLFPVRSRPLHGARELVSRELTAIGKMSRGEWSVAIVFALTAAAWVLREPLTRWDWLAAHLPALRRCDDTVIAMVAVMSLFILPVDARTGAKALDWDTAVRIPWGLLLLFGGGFSLADAVSRSGLDDWFGWQVEQLALPPLGMTLAVIVAIVLLTEMTSNTPTLAAFLPILHGAAVGMKIDPLLLMLPATISASCAFMLPVATPPNAIVFGSGHVTIRQMARAGIWMNVAAVVVIWTWTVTGGCRIFGIHW